MGIERPILYAALAVAFFCTGWTIPGMLCVLLAINRTSAWVHDAHERALLQGDPPRWLCMAETFRGYLANEATR